MSQQFLQLKKKTIHCMITFKSWVSRTSRNEDIFIAGLKVILNNLDFFTRVDATRFYDDWFIPFLEENKIKPLAKAKRKCIIEFFEDLKLYLQSNPDKYHLYNILNTIYKNELKDQLINYKLDLQEQENRKMKEKQIVDDYNNSSKSPLWSQARTEKDKRKKQQYQDRKALGL